MEGKDKIFIIHELLQNAWDTDATTVEVTMTRIPNSPFVEIEVTDNNPTGFNDIAHAYTLFAESEKKNDPTKRGRFNMGEKMVFALARNARVSTTKGAVIFGEGKKFRLSKRKADMTETGSVVWMEIRMTIQEEAEVGEMVKKVLTPEDKATYFNGEEIAWREPTAVVADVAMRTLADTQGDGVMRTTTRQTTLEIHDAGDSAAMVYEMGIPVVEMPDDKYSVNVMQKIPLNMDRDNISPRYRVALRGEILNATANLLTKDDAQATWVKEALEHKNLDTATIDKTMDKMIGKKRAIFNAKDSEANAGAVVAGYKVMHGGMLSKSAWKNVKSTGTTKATTQVGGGRFASHSFKMRNAIPTEMRLREDEWTVEMKRVACLTKRMCDYRGVSLHGVSIVKHLKKHGGRYAALAGGGRITFNLSTLGKDAFDLTDDARLSYMVSLISHEMAHLATGCSCDDGGHYNPRFRDHMERSIGEFTVLALRDRSFFTRKGTPESELHIADWLPSK